MQESKKSAIIALVNEYGGHVKVEQLLKELVARQIHQTNSHASNHVRNLVSKGVLVSVNDRGMRVRSVAKSCFIILAEPQQPVAEGVKTGEHPPDTRSISPLNGMVGETLTWLMDREQQRARLHEELEPKRDRLREELSAVEQEIKCIQALLQDPKSVEAEAALRKVFQGVRQVLERAGVV